MNIKSKYQALSKCKKICLWALVSVLIVGIAVGAFFGITAMPDQKFVKIVGEMDIYENDLSSRVPQTEIYDYMYEHFYNNTSGKTPKLLFLGYDGCLASVVRNGENSGDSAIFTLLGMGAKAYLGQAGGATVGDQATSTAPGWSSIFTGVWATETGVLDNGCVLNENTRSIIYSLAEDGISTSFSISWDTHFTTTYSKEIDSAKANGLPIVYTDSDDDSGTIQAVKSSLSSGTSATFCTLEFTDHQGHATGFNDLSAYRKAFLDLDAASNDILNDVFSRPTYAEEDWLIILASDHGGHGNNHGGTTYKESTTFFVVFDSALAK